MILTIPKIRRRIPREAEIREDDRRKRETPLKRNRRKLVRVPGLLGSFVAT
jgi:hypothetical protein